MPLIWEKPPYSEHLTDQQKRDLREKILLVTSFIRSDKTYKNFQKELMTLEFAKIVEEGRKKIDNQQKLKVMEAHGQKRPHQKSSVYSDSRPVSSASVSMVIPPAINKNLINRQAVLEGILKKLQNEVFALPSKTVPRSQEEIINYSWTLYKDKLNAKNILLSDPQNP